jgi:YggT family protein
VESRPNTSGTLARCAARALAAGRRAVYLGRGLDEGRTWMGSLIIILLYVINIMWFIVIAHVIMSWLIGFNVLNRHQPLVWQIWNGLERLLEPIYGPIRRVLPNMGGLDLSPLVLIVILYAIQTVLQRNAIYFY